jgi:hypothetical protein
MSKENKEIIIRVEGGVIQSIENIPNDMLVRVYDYDIEGTNQGDWSVDENGDHCNMSTYGDLSNNTRDSDKKREYSTKILMLFNELINEIRGVNYILSDAVKTKQDKTKCTKIHNRLFELQIKCGKLIDKIENPNA